jgi:D-beta-D-heptose 7-phosphate kinase/D-beta-D-heptose 1-phosphate adenosyltransferase
LLEKSKALGDYLIVGLNSDASVRRLKGIKRPINNQENRKKSLEAIKFVDEVVIFDEDTPYDLIKQLKPDIITKGGDYKAEDVVGNDLAIVVIIPFTDGYSTTKILGEL